MAQIALMIADVVSDSGGSSHPGTLADGAAGGAAARDTPAMIQVQNGKGESRSKRIYSPLAQRGR